MAWCAELLGSPSWIGNIAGASEHTAWGLHALTESLILLTRLLAWAANSRQIWNWEQITSLQMSPRHTQINRWESFWAKSVLCNHRTQAGEGSEYMCVYVCVLSWLSCLLWSSCRQLCFLSSLLFVNRKLICLPLSVFSVLSSALFFVFPWVPFSSSTYPPPSVSTYSISRKWQAPGRRFIRVIYDIAVSTGTLNQPLLTYFLLALFWSFLFFFLGFSLKSCQKLRATATLASDVFVVIFCCLSSSLYLARIWCSCVREVLRAASGLSFPTQLETWGVWTGQEVEETAGRRGRESMFGIGLAQHCFLYSLKISSLTPSIRAYAAKKVEQLV